MSDEIEELIEELSQQQIQESDVSELHDSLNKIGMSNSGAFGGPSPTIHPKLWEEYVQASIRIREEIELDKQNDLMVLLTWWFLRSWFDDINQELTNEVCKPDYSNALNKLKGIGVMDDSSSLNDRRFKR